MKYFIKTLTKFSTFRCFAAALALFSQLVFSVARAGDPMDAAIEQVNETRKQASVKAMNAVNEDFNFALSETMSELLKAQDFSQIKPLLVSEQKTLATGFEKIATLKPASVQELETQFTKVFGEYKDLVRLRYDSSYRIPETRAAARESLIYASRALRSFETNCTTGRGVGGKGAEAFYYPSLPKADFRVGIKYGTNGGEKSFDSSASASGSQAEKDRNTAVNVTGTAASITASIAYGGGTGAAVSAAATLAPFMIGVGVAVAVVAMYLSQQEKVKAENRIVEAKLYFFHEAADDRAVANYYVDHCKSLSSSVGAVRKMLDAALTNPEAMESMASQVPDLDQEVAAFRSILDKRAALFTAAMDAAKALKDAKPEDKASAQAAVQSAVAALKVSEVEVKAASTPEKVANVTLAFLLDKQSKLQDQFSDLNFQAVDIVQRRAFENIQHLVALVLKENFRKFISGDDALGSEFRSLDEFMKARAEFKDVLVAQIKFIFGRIDAGKLNDLQLRLASDTKKLTVKYGHVMEVSNFARQVNLLLTANP